MGLFVLSVWYWVMFEEFLRLIGRLDPLVYGAILIGGGYKLI